MSYIVVGLCKFVEDNKGTSDKMIGFYYCVVHSCRTTKADVCWRGSKELLLNGQPSPLG